MKAEKELQVVELMIRLYCKKKHKTKKGQLCSDCQALLQYAQLRRQKCPFGDNKTFCSNCKVHCYKSEMREKIRQVMRFACPRMIFSHPLLALKHVVETKREKKKLLKISKKQSNSQLNQKIKEQQTDVR